MVRLLGTRVGGGGVHLELCKVVPFVVVQRRLLFVRVRRVSCVYYGIVSTCFYYFIFCRVFSVENLSHKLPLKHQSLVSKFPDSFYFFVHLRLACKIESRLVSALYRGSCELYCTENDLSLLLVKGFELCFVRVTAK